MIKNFATMKKRVIDSHEKKYLIGKRNGMDMWLLAPSWDCDWYWGFGYVRTYANNNPKNDLLTHEHFDELFLSNRIFDSFVECLDETPLTEKEVFTLLELMETFYNCRKFADTCHRGGSHITNNPCHDVLLNANLYEKINHEIIPQLFDAIDKLLSVSKETE